MAKEKIVLAYSGGLDTTVIIPWLKENYDAEVICVCGDVGQGKETDGLEEKAVATGASKLYVMDLTEEFITDYIYPCLKADCIYESKYLLGTSMARPLIAKSLVDIAHKENASAICHVFPYSINSVLNLNSKNAPPEDVSPMRKFQI